MQKIMIKGLKLLQKKKGIFNPILEVFGKFKDKKLVGQLRYSTYFMKHPMDGSYGVRREGKSSWIASGIILAVFILISVIYKYFCGFLFKTVREGDYDLVMDKIGLKMPFFFCKSLSPLITSTIARITKNAVTRLFFIQRLRTSQNASEYPSKSLESLAYFKALS